MADFVVSASPQITKKGNSTRGIMTDVLIALAPSIVAATFFFGYHVIINLIVCAASCWGFELLYDLAVKKAWSKEGIKSSSVWNFSCFVTGVLLALNLPATMDIWGLNVTAASGRVLFSFDTVLVCMLGSLVAIVLVKQLFGGIGRNFANPALTARVFLFLTFAAKFAASDTIGLGFQATTGATWLAGSKTATADSLYDMFIGNVGSAAVGETCVIAILLGYVYLSLRKTIDFRVPLMIIAWATAFALLFDGLAKQHLTGSALFYNMIAHVMSGGLLFGAVFMATDYATSPNTFRGNCVFAFGIALLTMLIRTFAAYPEGMSFAVLIMNCVTPLINRFIYPRPFGYIKPEKKKKPKPESAAKEATK